MYIKKVLSKCPKSRMGERQARKFRLEEFIRHQLKPNWKITMVLDSFGLPRLFGACIYHCCKPDD